VCQQAIPAAAAFLLNRLINLSELTMNGMILRVSSPATTMRNILENYLLISDKDGSVVDPANEGAGYQHKSSGLCYFHGILEGELLEGSEKNEIQER